MRKDLIAVLALLFLQASPSFALKSRRYSRMGDDPKEPRVSSQSAIVVSVPMGQVLYEKDADEVRPIASLSKLMSAIVYMDRCAHLDLDGLHEMTVKNREFAKGGDKTHLNTGWSYSRRDLLKRL